MTEPSPRELLHEWQQRMESVVASAASLAGRSEPSRQLLEAMQREVELVQQIVERERRLQREVTDQLLAPVDTVFDLLEQSGTTFRQQSEALAAAGRALEETARQMERQAEIFERTIATLRRPAKLAKDAAGSQRRPGKPGGRRRSR